MIPVPEDSLVSARDVGREFVVGGETVRAVRDVNMDIFPGEVVAMLGRSGSGKTTLLNLLGSLDTPTSGTVYYQGQDLSNFSGSELSNLRRDHLGFVFQSFGLLPLLSAKENVELPLRIAGAARGDREDRTRAALDAVAQLLLNRAPIAIERGDQLVTPKSLDAIEIKRFR